MNHANRVMPRRLDALPRGGGETLRVDLMEIEGTPYVAVGTWDLTPHGQPKPAKGKTVRIRLDEIPRVIAALSRAVTPQDARHGDDAGDDGQNTGQSQERTTGHPGAPGGGVTVDPSRAAPWEG